MNFTPFCKADRFPKLRCMAQTVGVAAWLLGTCAVSSLCLSSDQDAPEAPGAGVHDRRPVKPEESVEPDGAAPTEEAETDEAAEEPKEPNVLDLMRKEMAAQLRPVLYAEIYFVHLVCGTNAQERRELLAAAEPELEKVVTSAALQALAPGARPQAVRIMRDNQIVIVEGGDIQIRGNRIVVSETEPAEMLAEVLMRLAAEQLGQERGDRLRNEMQQRVEAQRRATIGQFIARLDSFLLLSSAQQEELAQRLLPVWRDDWRRIPLAVSDQYLPDMMLPSETLTVLSPAQQKQYWAIPRISFVNQRRQQPPALNLAQEADRWKAILEKLDRAEQQGDEQQGGSEG